MKRTVFAIVLLGAMGLQAQVLNVNNKNGTYLPLETEYIKEITFDEERKVVALEMSGGLSHSFYTVNVESLSPKTDKTSRLTYNLAPEVAFDAVDAFDEIVETIIYDSTDKDYSDFVDHYNPTTIVDIVFAENSVSVSGNKANIVCSSNGGHLIVNDTIGKVKYRVSGKCDDGSLKIYSTKKFQLELDGLELTNPVGPAINIQSGKTTYFTIKDNSVNKLCDGKNYAAAAVGSDGSEEDQKGTLFSEGQLVFNGNGTLNVTSLGGHAICSDDYIRIRSGYINVLAAAKDGFHTNDKFILDRTKEASPVIIVKAVSNGIDCGKGEVIINAGKLDLETGGEAIKVEYESQTSDQVVVPNFTINGGYIKFVTKGDKGSGIKTTGEYRQTGGVIHGTVYGNGSKVLNCDGVVSFTGGVLTALSHGTVLNGTTLAGGIKSVGDVRVSGGRIAIECTGEGAKGINGDANVTITGGDVTIIAAAGNVTIAATAGNSSEADKVRKNIALDATNVVVTNGNIMLKAYEKAVSAAGFMILGGNFHAVSEGDVAIDIDAGIQQYGGWLLTKE